MGWFKKLGKEPKKELNKGPLTGKDFHEVFRINGLDQVSKHIRRIAGAKGEGVRPLVLYTGSGIGNILKGSRQYTVKTVHGPTKLLVGYIEGVPDLPVVVVPRHSDPKAKDVGHHKLPHQINASAHSVAVTALNPLAVVTMHTVGVSNAKPSFQPGSFAVVGDLMRGSTQNTIHSETVSKAILKAGYSLPHLSHTSLSPEKLNNPKLEKIIRAAAKSARMPLIADNVVGHNAPGPTFETKAEVEDLIRRGAHVFGMTYQDDAVLLQEALHTGGGGTPVCSVAYFSNFGEGLEEGKSVSHDEVDASARKTEEIRDAFFRCLAAEVKNSLVKPAIRKN